MSVPQVAAVVVLIRLRGQTKEGHERMLAGIGALLRRAPGLLAHGAHPVPGGWEIMEFWRSAADAQTFFDGVMSDAIARGIRVKRTVTELHALLVRAEPV